MRRNIFSFLILSLSLGLGLVSCDESTTAPFEPPNPAAEVGDTLRGPIKGVMKGGRTYYLWEDAFVGRGDTLVIEPGAKLIAPRVNPIDQSVYTLYIRGALLAEGTEEQMIYMGPGDDRKFFGSWGGIQCDSPAVVSFRFVNMEYAGGIRPSGQPRPAIYFFSNAAGTSRFIMEDCRIYGPIDNGFTLYGGSGRIVRNSFDMIGENNGSAMNFKTGFKGTVAYNYIYNALDHGIQAETSTTILYPQTDLLIHNNTFVNSGFRNPSRHGAGVIMNQFARGRIYNNLFVNCRMGIRITPAADTANIEYGNNLFHTTVDSLTRYFYPPDAIGRPRPSDLIQVDPMFISYDGFIGNRNDDTDPRPRPGSPIFGAGNPVYDQDLGAFTSRR